MKKQLLVSLSLAVLGGLAPAIAQDADTGPEIVWDWADAF